MKPVLGTAKADPAGAARPARRPAFARARISPGAIAPYFKANGTMIPTIMPTPPRASKFRRLEAEVGGLVERPMSLSLADLRAMPARTQITRHDCVEGWSCIGRWKGARRRS